MMLSLPRIAAPLIAWLLLAPACKDQPAGAPIEARTGDAGAPIAGDAAPVAADGGPAAGDIQASLTGEPQLPAGWTGIGVLAERSDPTPRHAPDWTRIAAEVTHRDEQRFLQATGRAARIRNPALARSTAEARARAELARWTVAGTLRGTQVIESWRDPGSGTCYARVAMAVPADWTPGQPLEPDSAAGEVP